MSAWPEEQTLEDFIGNSDLGKDMYIAGIKRGLVKQTTNHVSISGKGWLTDMYAYATNVSGRLYNGSTTVKIDGDLTITLVSNTTSISLGVNPDIIAQSVEIPKSGDLTFTGSVVLNAPLRFEQSLEIVGDGHGYYEQNFTGSYILDPENVGGNA